MVLTAAGGTSTSTGTSKSNGTDSGWVCGLLLVIAEVRPTPLIAILMVINWPLIPDGVSDLRHDGDCRACFSRVLRVLSCTATLVVLVRGSRALSPRPLGDPLAAFVAQLLEVLVPLLRVAEATQKAGLE